MYKNIIFDIGGVVVNYSPKDFLLDKFYNTRTENIIYDSMFGSEEWQLLDKGQITWRQATEVFMRRAEESDLAFEMLAVLEEWTDMLTTRKATVTLMRLLKKKGFNLYYLSNISKEVMHFLRNRDFWPLFSGGIASFSVGIAKPDIEIYRLLLKEFSILAKETIFTDDKRENAEAAYSAGVMGIQFTDVKNFCKQLAPYGIDTTG